MVLGLWATIQEVAGFLDNERAAYQYLVALVQFNEEGHATKWVPSHFINHC